MSPPIPIQLLSDSDDDNTADGGISLNTPISNHINKKRPRPNFELPISDDVLIIPVDDEPTPSPHHKLIKCLGSASSSLIVPETPFSDSPLKPSRYCPGDVELIDVEAKGKELVVNKVCSGFDGGKDLEPLFSSSSEEENKKKNDDELDKWLDIDCRAKEGVGGDIHVECLDDSPLVVQSPSRFRDLQSTKAHHSPSFQDGVNQLQPLLDKDIGKESIGLESDYKVIGKEPNKGQAVNKNTAKEEKLRLMEEKKRKKEQEKLQKAALKAEAAKLREQEKEKKKLEKSSLVRKTL